MAPSTPYEEIRDAERQEAGAIAHAIEKQVHAALYRGREALWELSEALYDFDEARGWLGLGFDTLKEWLAQPEHVMSRSQYHKLVSTWRKLVVERRIDADRLRLLDQSKVAIVTKAITSAEVLVDEVLADVEVLAARDLRRKYEGEPKKVSTLRLSEQELHRCDTPAEVEPDTPEPVRADEVEAEVLVGEVVELEPNGWLTPEVRARAIGDLDIVIDNGASFPRVKRDTCLAAREALQCPPALPEAVRALLSGPQMARAVEDIDKAIEKGTHGDNYPVAALTTFRTIRQLLDELGVD